MKFRVASDQKSESSRVVEGEGANQKCVVQKVSVSAVEVQKNEPSFCGEITLCLPPGRPPLVAGKVYQIELTEVQSEE